MKIDFRQSGGVGGIFRGCELDTDQMSDDERRTVETLISHVRQSGPPVSSNSGGDLTQYQLTVSTEDDQWSTSADDMTMTPELYPLVEFLKEYSRPRKPW